MNAQFQPVLNRYLDPEANGSTPMEDWIVRVAAFRADRSVMARSPHAPVNGDTLIAARSSSGHTTDSAAGRLGVPVERLSSWELGIELPTLVQLRKIAQLYQTTTAALLSKNTAFDERPQVPDFRRNHNRPMTTALVAELRRARERRRRLLELVGPTGDLPQLSVNRGDIEQTATAVRTMVGIDVPAQLKFKDPRVALNAWIHGVERLGIIVFQVSRIPTSDFLGMSLFEEPQPIVLLNGADDAQRRIFTLFHEVGHLLGRTSGICDIYTDSASESVCNAFAAAFLLPRKDILAELGDDDAVDALSSLSRRFRVSQSAVAVRLHQLKRMSSKELVRQLAIAREIANRPKPDAAPGSQGPPFHVVKLRNLGETYVSAVLDAMHDGAISPVDASYYLEAKLPAIEKMQDELTRRAVGT